MKNQYHHVYRFWPIVINVLLEAIVPVGFIAVLIQHPIYTIAFVAVYVGLSCLLIRNMKVIGRNKLRKGEACQFTGVCFADGSKLTEKIVASVFGIHQRPLVLNSFEGPIALVHGIPSYRSGFFDGTKAIGTQEMADLFPKGTGYWLISCHNGFHGNFAREGQLFVRPICTMDEYPVAFDFDEKTNTAIVWSGVELQTMEFLMLPTFLYIAPLAKVFLNAFVPLENMLHNGHGDRRNQLDDIRKMP